VYSHQLLWESEIVFSYFCFPSTYRTFTNRRCLRQRHFVEPSITKHCFCSVISSSTRCRSLRCKVGETVPSFELLIILQYQCHINITNNLLLTVRTFFGTDQENIQVKQFLKQQPSVTDRLIYKLVACWIIEIMDRWINGFLFFWMVTSYQWCTSGFCLRNYTFYHAYRRNFRSFSRFGRYSSTFRRRLKIV